MFAAAVNSVSEVKVKFSAKDDTAVVFSMIALHFCWVRGGEGYFRAPGEEGGVTYG
jgi:hypothetical protein